jgi:hypothetical protein
VDLRVCDHGNSMLFNVKGRIILLRFAVVSPRITWKNILLGPGNHVMEEGLISTKMMMLFSEN